MHERNEIKRLEVSSIPLTDTAIQMYTCNGGHLTMESNFGLDPLKNDSEKYMLRCQSFQAVCPPFHAIFSEVVNGKKETFKEKLLLFIDITRRLS